MCVGDPTNHRYRIDLVVEGMQGRLAVECDGDEWHGPERYEQDMARQRDLERAGWQFVRIRGGDFYRDSGKATEPLWSELDRLGIKPGGIDEAAAEPPSPADRQDIERMEADEVIPVSASLSDQAATSIQRTPIQSLRSKCGDNLTKLDGAKLQACVGQRARVFPITLPTPVRAVPTLARSTSAWSPTAFV